MRRPFRYTVFCNKTNKVIAETNILPLLHSLQTYEPIQGTNKSGLTVTKTVYEDTRFKAKMRLYNYLTFKRHGKDIPRYNPFGDSKEVGKSIPILIF